ncbi:allophanate hydrolase subunit 1 [Catenulispora yoronensis]|uniref:Allophanate hydrolase subunit 1 n=1 Tax=Catenulispora yoronensis TaxID=450799 RepID=A0ABN2UG32_9ACTN
MSLRIRPCGPEALLIDLDDIGLVGAVYADLLRLRADGQLPGVQDIVPAAATVLLDGVADPRALAARLAELEPRPQAQLVGDTVEVRARYDGPDLDDVARLWGVSPADVVRIHCETEFRVAFAGFAPGFGYLVGLPERYAVPRRSTARVAVPAGAIGLAGAFTGVYPRRSPGGWQLIGTTDAVLWDAERQPPALFVPGTRVRFVAEDGDQEDGDQVDGDQMTANQAVGHDSKEHGSG